MCVSETALSNYYPLFLSGFFSLFIEHTTTTTNLGHFLQFRLNMLSDLGFDHIRLILTQNGVLLFELKITFTHSADYTIWLNIVDESARSSFSTPFSKKARFGHFHNTHTRIFHLSILFLRTKKSALIIKHQYYSFRKRKLRHGFFFSNFMPCFVCVWCTDGAFS